MRRKRKKEIEKENDEKEKTKRFWITLLMLPVSVGYLRVVGF